MQLAGVDGVTAVMAGTVGHKGDLLGVWAAILARTQGVQLGADGAHDFQIGFLVPAAHVVGFSRLAGGQHATDSRAVVGDKQPVTDIAAVAINRQRLAGQGIENHQRDQLFRVMKGAVIIRAVGGQHGQAVSMKPGADQMVGCRFRRRIRAVGLVWMGFGEWRIARLQRAVHFIGGHMQETKCLTRPPLQGRPVCACRLQQGERAIDIGPDEFTRTMNGTVNVALGGKIDDGDWLIPGHHLVDTGAIRNVAMHKLKPGCLLDRSQTFQMPGVCQCIQYHHGRVWRMDKPLADKIAANKSRPT